MSDTAAEWFVYDPVDGASFYATEEEARSRAENLLDEERDNSGYGWNENVTEICYGRVHGHVVQTKCEPAPEGSEFDEYWGFALKTIVEDHQDKHLTARIAELEALYEVTEANHRRAQADARILAHSYEHDSRPPEDVVKRALGYPVKP